MPGRPSTANPRFHLAAARVASGETISEAARHLGVSDTTARRWGRLKAFKALVAALRREQAGAERGRLAELARAAFDRHGAGAALEVLRSRRRFTKSYTFGPVSGPFPGRSDEERSPEVAVG